MFTDSNQNKATAWSVNSQGVLEGGPISIQCQNTGNKHTELTFFDSCSGPASRRRRCRCLSLLAFRKKTSKRGGIVQTLQNLLKIYWGTFADTAAPLSGDSSCTNECFHGLIHLFEPFLSFEDHRFVLSF